jgi:hypothetical protein
MHVIICFHTELDNTNIDRAMTAYDIGAPGSGCLDSVAAVAASSAVVAVAGGLLILHGVITVVGGL